MSRQLEWMTSAIPVLIGSVIIVMLLFSSNPLILNSLLKLISLTTTVQNFLRNKIGETVLIRMIGAG